ncbi:MAG TPA: phosphoribosylanthranilate isomerase [Clostridia bacterium]
MTKIKLCGLRTHDDIDIVNTYMPDYVGFVFVPNSKRYVSISEAKAFKQRLNKGIKAVGVFQNSNKDEIVRAVDMGVVDIVQLHGEEDQNYIDSVKKLGCQVIKAYMIKAHIPAFLKSDYIMLDNHKGGSGQSFDWDLIDFDLHNTFLAGGINIDNINKALTKKPYCIDISSGAERNGNKDEVLIKELIKAVRNG